MAQFMSDDTGDFPELERYQPCLKKKQNMHISSIPYLLFQYYLQTTSPIVINRLNEISFVSIEIASNSTCMRTIYFPKSTIRIQTGHTTWSSPLPAFVSKCTTVSSVFLNPVEYRAYLTPMNAVPNRPIAIDAIQSTL